ncbi:hypothetical protein NBRC116594_03850 [Shimia sp. NS0008-38b]|uniref:calcium-binding protein n=1 Tax=Shimia sp. NS0008-38b TaxID=3127653 RepID=UPI0031062FE4
MLLLGLLLTGLAVGAIVDMTDDNDDNTETPRTEDDTPRGDTTTSDITTDGELGLLVEGSDGDNVIFGTEGPDILSGEDGDDSIRGRDSSDRLLGGEGNDSLYGQNGDDILVGGDDDDELHGGRADDTLLGSEGNDTLFGGPGNDDLVGADITNRDLTVDDWMLDRTGPGPYTFEAPTTTEANELHGGDGDDFLLLGEGDTGSGGAGDDAFLVGQWVEDEDNVPLITDFNEEDDQLLIYYPEGEATPTITLGTEGDQTLVYANGQLMVRVEGDGGPFFAGDVAVVEFT